MNSRLKKYSNFINEVNIEDEDLLKSFSNFDKFRHMMINHPDYETSDLVAVYVGNKFTEDEDGRYIKLYEPLTNIMKITPDKESFTNVNMMQFRGKMQDSTGLMVIQWVSKDIADDMIDEIRDGWESEEGQFYLKTLVDHYKEHSLGKKRGR